MTSKYKILSIASLCMFLSPLVYAETASCQDDGMPGGKPAIIDFIVQCETKDRINVPNGSYVYAEAVSTRNKDRFKLGSEQVPTKGTFSVIRNVVWGPDSIYVQRDFSGISNFKQKQNLGKTHKFHAKINSQSFGGVQFNPKIKITIWGDSK